MGLHGSVPGTDVPEDLDLDTIELLLRFFTMEELVGEYQLHDLNVRELTILKATVLQELARQIAALPALRSEVRARLRVVWNALRSGAQE
jgi:hypothetical protein